MSKDKQFAALGNEYLNAVRAQHRKGRGERAPADQVLSRFEHVTPRKQGPAAVDVDRVAEFIDILRNRI